MTDERKLKTRGLILKGDASRTDAFHSGKDVFVPAWHQLRYIPQLVDAGGHHHKPVHEMSFLTRASLRTVARRPIAIRRLATEAAESPLPTAAQSPFIANLEAVEHHAAGMCSRLHRFIF
jgi:hypothetical protein